MREVDFAKQKTEGEIVILEEIEKRNETENIKMKYYNKSKVSLAKTLRKNMTPWERKLWYDFLRNYPVRFQRQKAIGNYIADFYCAKARLIVELDGSVHYTARHAEKDKARTRKLEGMHLTVLRVSNSDIDRNFSGVCDYINHIVKLSLYR